MKLAQRGEVLCERCDWSFLYILTFTRGYLSMVMEKEGVMVGWTQ